MTLSESELRSLYPTSLLNETDTTRLTILKSKCIPCFSDNSDKLFYSHEIEQMKNQRSVNYQGLLN